MQAELRLSVGEHSFLTTYLVVFTIRGSGLEKATSRNLAVGSTFAIETVFHPNRLLLVRTHTEPFHEHQGQGPEICVVVKRKMGVFAGICFYEFGILRIRRLHASAEGELIEAKLSSMFKKHKTKLNAECKNPLTKLVQ